MASRTIVTLIDDIDGSTATEQIKFGLDGQQFEIDLSTANAQGLRDALAPYISVGRRTGRRPSPSGRRSPRELKDLREWAQANGHEVANRGRVPQRIVDLFEASH